MGSPAPERTGNSFVALSPLSAQAPRTLFTMSIFRTLLALLIALLAVNASAQKNYKRLHYQMLDQARILLNAEDHSEAARLYKKLLPVDTTFGEVYHAYGVCLMNIPDMKEHAAPYLERAVRHNHTEAYLELGRVRHRQQRFEEAIDLLERYKKLHMRALKDTEVDRFIQWAANGRELVREPIPVRITNMGPSINSSAHDYSPVVTADGSVIYFTSRRQGTRGGMKDPTGQYFEDIYMARRFDDMWSVAMNAGSILNTTGHDATVGLAPDGSSMIIYRTGADQVSGDLYETRLLSHQWQKPELMTDKINSRYHEPSAAIAPGGEEVYFSSDRPGGYGGRDLYRIRRLPNGQWSTPLNLGPTINTMHDEDAPFIHSDGTTLFFSSNGHNTMGGYDIFKSVLVDADMNGWDKPVNMGYPLNTVNDDIYFVLSEDGRTGYFSSERQGGLGMQDIYEIVFPNDQLDHLFVRGVVADASDEPIQARLLVSDPETGEVLGVYNTNARTGRFLLLMTEGKRYHIEVDAPGHNVRHLELTASATVPGSREMDLDVLLVALPDRDRMSRKE
jgi:hypothetical protein